MQQWGYRTPWRGAFDDSALYDGGHLDDAKYIICNYVYDVYVTFNNASTL